VHPTDLKPGDICLWLKPTTLDSGHMLIIAGEPKVNTKRNSEVFMRIFDSSKAHTVDSRTGSTYPLGLGATHPWHDGGLRRKSYRSLLGWRDKPCWREGYDNHLRAAEPVRENGKSYPESLKMGKISGFILLKSFK